MVAMVYVPMSALVVPAWIQAGLVIAGLGASAILSGWSQKYPKAQRVVVGMALAVAIALAMTQTTQAVGMECPSWAWWLIDCWFAN